MRSYLPSLGVAGVIAACLVSGSAFAYSTGQNGYSGKPPAQSCASSTCHQPGASTPTVTLEGPDTLQAGATGNYTLIISGGPGTRGGFNVAVDNNSASLGAGTGSKKVSGEVTHSQPKAFSGGTVRFDFTLVAPASGGNITLYGAGNSTNGNTTEFGDASATATKAITVTGGSGGDEGDDEGGCAAAGGAPLLGAALLLLGARLRRRAA